MRPASWYAEKQIGLHLDCTVGALDPAEKILLLSDDTRLRYANLALTTGARAVFRQRSVATALAYS